MVIKMSNLNVDFTAILAGTHGYVIIANFKKNSKDKTDPRYIHSMQTHALHMLHKY